VGHANRSQTLADPAVRAGGKGLVRRGDLFERLAEAGRVTVVSAPPGSGKTVLVRSWIDEAGLSDRTAWVSLARDGPGAEGFWISLLDALRGTVAGSTVIRELTPAPGLDGQTIVEGLLEDVRSLEDRLWLVIDDVHELGSGDALRELALFALRAPANVRLVLLTRRDLRLGLNRLRLEGELTEIRAAQLRFSLDEARALFDAAGTPLPDSALALLQERTEGWAAGLRLAALSLEGSEDPDRFAVDFSGSERVVAEYLLDEVLDRLPDERTQLLLRTSILERVNGPLADLLTGATGSEEVLHELESANAFVVSLDAQRSWFRYHHLFADLLQLGLRQAAPDDVPALHRRAAAWFDEHGYPVEAVRHAQAAEDWALAARLLSDNSAGLYLDGRTATVHDALAAFPPRMRAANAELVVLTVSDELSHGSLEQAEHQLALAKQLSASVADERRVHLQTRLAGAQLELGRQRGDLAMVVEESQRLLAHAESAGVAWRDEELRAWLLLNLGGAEVWTAQLEEGEQHLEQALALARRADRPYIAVACLAHQCLALGFRSYQRAWDAGTEAVELAAQHGWGDAPVVGLAYIALGGIRVWQGRLEEGQAWLDRAQRALTPELEPAEGSLLYNNRGLLELARGRNEEALAAFRAAVRLDGLRSAPNAIAVQARALMLQATLRLGQTEGAEHELASLDQPLRETAEMRKATALLALARDDPEGASAALAPVIDRSVAVVSPLRLYEILVIEATVRDALGDAGAAGRALEQALELAESDGLVLAFLLHPAPELLERHQRLGTAHASLVSDILSALAGKPQTSAPGTTEPLLDPLSESELRVLRYLPTNLSAREIANELYVTANTVKTHMHHIYVKLGVHGRAEAVEQARGLGLLAPSALRRR
jgi:LuxR family maltose regulon positive regulatory protein